MKQALFILIFISGFGIFAQNSLMGTWNNDELGILILNANGNGSLGSDQFTFTSANNKIIATDVYGESLSYSYKLLNGKLVISGGYFTEPVMFTRSKDNFTESGTAIGKTPGNIDKSIVGTWCSTNASGVNTNATSSNAHCIVINGDGTYQYTYEGSISGYGGGYYGGSSSQNSDHGNWKLNGNIISVVSASEGAQTFSFQKKNHPKTGDPMIVIDGDAYVTYYKKNPW